MDNSNEADASVKPGAIATGSQDSVKELQYLKLVLDQHAIVSIANASGDITYVNDKFCQVSQYRREELLGRNHRILKSGVHDAAFFTDMWETISSGNIWQGEVCNRNKAGGLYWVETTIVPFMDEQGLPYQYISIRTEVTRIKQVEEMLAASKAELEVINASLEDKVKARTEELRRAMASIEAAHEKLKKGFITSIRVFSSLIEMREGSMAGHSRRVAELARAIAQRMGMGAADVQDVFLAALLHNVGKIGLPDHLLEKPFSSLSSKELIEVKKHPVKGYATLMALEQLHGAAKLIRNYHEHFDGTGYPDKLAGASIPLGARILAVANDYDAAKAGTLLPRHLNQAEAVNYIRKKKGLHYDPAVVDAFLDAMGESHEEIPAKRELVLHAKQIKAGMAVSQDVVSNTGELLLGKDRILDEHLIEQLQWFERTSGSLLNIHVHADG